MINQKSFRELDTIGIVNQQEHQRTVKEEDAVNQFNSSCHFDGERYEVGLPWKKEHPHLVDNCDLSHKNILNGSRSNAERNGTQTGDERLGKPFETGTVNG